jgi:CubicO group peptidase (beta-lactamase class C family)
MSGSSSSTAPGDELLPATRRALTHRVAVGQADGRAPSLTGAVVRDGRLAWCGARSMLDGHEPDGDTQYRIGSLTKTFVAVLVMRLRDEGLVDLAEPVGKYVDAGQAEGITVHHLLSHTSGLAARWSATCAVRAGTRSCGGRSWNRSAWRAPPSSRSRRTRGASRSTRGPT